MENLAIWIVTIESRRFFDDCQYSYLPVFNKIFGVYYSREEAEKEVWKHFADKYEICFDDYDPEGEYLGYDDAFMLVDEKYGGKAIYGIDYHQETLFLK